MNKSKSFALITGTVLCTFAVVSYAATTTFVPLSTLEITIPAQPVPGIAPSGALHVPFTKFDLTAHGSDIVVEKITVVRVGPADDEAFEDIVLLDAHGVVLADGALDDDHTVEFTDALYIPRNTTISITVAANMADDVTEFDGQMSTLAVTEILASGYAALK